MAVQYSGAATRTNVFSLPSGRVLSITRVTDQNVTNQVGNVRIKSKLKRISWRELTK
jgi:hypothetical protein